MEKQQHNDQKETAENSRNSKLEDQLDSDVNTKGFPRPQGESQTMQEDPDTDPNQTDKPGFERSDV